MRELLTILAPDILLVFNSSLSSAVVSNQLLSSILRNFILTSLTVFIIIDLYLFSQDLRERSIYLAKVLSDLRLFKMVSDIQQNSDFCCCIILCCRTFNLFDNCILKLTCPDWPYLRAMSAGNTSSSSATITSGVPQGSILGPLLFSICMKPLGQVIHNSNISFHYYADNTLTVNPSDVSSVYSLIICLRDVKSWTSNNVLC